MGSGVDKVARSAILVGSLDMQHDGMHIHIRMHIHCALRHMFLIFVVVFDNQLDFTCVFSLH